MSDEMLIRLRCMNKTCGREFDRPDSIVEDEGTFLREKRCPFCDCDATTLADVQPRPPIWWSDSTGLIQQMPRTTATDEIRYRVLDGQIGNRAISTLPLDAVPMALKPESDEHRGRRQRAADRVAKFLDQIAKLEDTAAGGRAHEVGFDRALIADLRLLIEAAPVLPPKWSGLTADPEVYIVQQTGEARTDALIRAREVLNHLESRGPGAEVFSDGLIALTVQDLKVLCDLDGAIVFVGFSKERAARLADGERTALTWTAVHQ